MRKPNAPYSARAILAALCATLIAALTISCSNDSRVSAISPVPDPARIAISRQGDPFTVVLTRDGPSWSLGLGDTRRYPVSESRMSAFLSTLAERRPVARVASGDAERYGIGVAGSYAVTVSGNGAVEGSHAKTDRLHFGNADATGEWQYFSRGGDNATYRTSSAIAEFLDVRASSWAELSPYRKILASCDVQDILVRYATNPAGSRYRAGTDPEADEFGAALAKLTAIDITNYPSDPAITVEITFGNASRAILDFTPLGDDWILADRITGLSYVVSGGSKRELLTCLSD